MKLGDAIGSNYDILQIQGVSQGTLLPNANILLDTLTFTAGPNAYTPAVYDGTYSFAQTVSIGTGSVQLVVPFDLSINYADTLTIPGGNSLSILVGSTLWTLVVNALTIGPNSGGPEVGYLYAHVTESPAATPLPAAILLFGSGLGGMVLVGRRRKARSALAA
jgi:hypothetical protein